MPDENDIKTCAHCKSYCSKTIDHGECMNLKNGGLTVTRQMNCQFWAAFSAPDMPEVKMPDKGMFDVGPTETVNNNPDITVVKLRCPACENDMGVIEPDVPVKKVTCNKCKQIYIPAWLSNHCKIVRMPKFDYIDQMKKTKVVRNG